MDLMEDKVRIPEWYSLNCPEKDRTEEEEDFIDLRNEINSLFV